MLRRLLALSHPVMPFVTEEIYSYLRAAAPGVEPEMLVAHPFGEPDPALVDPDAERELADSIELTRRLRRWRDMVGARAGSVLAARVADGAEPHELVGRLARFSFDGERGEAIATVGPVEVLPSDEIDAEQVRGRIEERREALRAEVERARRKLENEGFVGNAPDDVVEAEREKLTAYAAELDELGKWSSP